jgi:hypothetical protein
MEQKAVIPSRASASPVPYGENRILGGPKLGAVGVAECCRDDSGRPRRFGTVSSRIASRKSFF